jgi:hypothetical protein
MVLGWARSEQNMLCINFLSGRRDLNPGPLAPHASALAGLRHAPIYLDSRVDYSALGRI